MAARDRLRGDCLMIPVDPQSGPFGRMCQPITNVQTRVGDGVQLRNIFQHLAVGYGADQTDVQLHQEMGADGDVHRLGHMGDLQPRGDATHAGHIDLHNAAGTSTQIISGTGPANTGFRLPQSAPGFARQVGCGLPDHRRASVLRTM